MPLPSITISGNLTRDPEVRFLQSGTSVTSLRVGASDRKKDENGNCPATSTSPSGGRQARTPPSRSGRATAY